MATIKSIKVLRNTKYNTITVYVNLDNGRYEVYTKEGEKRNFTGKPELLDEAKNLAMVNGKWINWTAASFAPRNNRTDIEDTRSDIEELRNFKNQPTSYPTEEELANSGL